MERRRSTVEVDGFRVELLLNGKGPDGISIVCLSCKHGLLVDNFGDLERMSNSHGPGKCDGD